MSSKLFKNKLSVATLAIRYNDNLESVCINDYRVNGVKWNDVDNGRCLATSIKLDDVLKALNIYKEIADLQHKLKLAEKAFDNLYEKFKIVAFEYAKMDTIPSKLHFKEQAESELKGE